MPGKSEVDYEDEAEDEGFDEAEQDEREVGGQESEDASLDDGEEQAPRQREGVRGRGEDRFQRLANENRVLRERLDRLEPEVRRPAQQVQREETEEEFRARIADLSPDERMEARFERSERRNQAQIAAANFNAVDAADRAAYNAKASTNRMFAKYADAVETELAKARAQGVYASREAILAHIIGTKALTGGNDDISREQRRAQRRLERQRTNPPNNRSDAGARSRETRGSPGAENDREARRRRLENQSF